MKNTENAWIRLISIIVIALLLLPWCTSLAAAQDAEGTPLITTRAAFEKALNAAADGDTLLVGDIDFNASGDGAVNEAERIRIHKSITLKNGKTDGNAVFRGASFLLDGTHVAGEESHFSFIGITMDEGLDADEITKTDWELSYFGDGTLISATPLKCQFAIECRGNATASFTDCAFKNYMSPEGAAIRAFYRDDTTSLYRLRLELNGCSFEGNSALYGGGAIYVQALDGNATVNATDCRFTDNRAGYDSLSVGGGAIYLFGTKATLVNCVLSGNTANHFYGGDRFFDFGFVPEMGGNFILYEDRISGGALLASESELTMRGCTLTENAASFGGAIALEICTADIEDCVIADNRAVSVLEEQFKNQNLGVGSANGLGGAIYIDAAHNVTIGNTEIRGNRADSAYGAIYATYFTFDPEFYMQFQLNLLFCTVRENTCAVAVSDYLNNDGTWIYDTHAIPYVKSYGCLVVDSIYETDVPRAEAPTEENGFNYYAHTAPTEWEGENGHLMNAPTVSTDFVKENLGDRNYYGSFTVGANNHDVTYRFLSDGVCHSTLTLPTGEEPTIPALEKTGYTLTSWTLAEEFDYQVGRPFIVGNATGSVDLCAVFTPNVYTVTYNFGNGQSTESAQTYNTALSLPEVPEKQGYTFKGWFPSENGEGELLDAALPFTTAENVTYYAYYEKDFPVLVVVIASVGALLALGLAALAIVVFRHRHPHVPVPADGIAVGETRETPDTSMLSPREKEVLTLLLEGKQRNEIAAILFVSENTVKKQISSIYQKLGVSTRSELFARFK